MFINLLKYSLKNIARNTFLSISSILVLTLLMFFINIMLILHDVSFKLIDTINSKMSISLYLLDEYDKNSNWVIDLINDIKAASPESKVTYKNKDEVLQDIWKKDEELVQILEQSNPLPNTIIVSNIPLTDYDKVNYVIAWKLFLFESKKDDLKKKKWILVDYKSQYLRIEQIITILKKLWFGLYLIIAVFVISIWIIIYSIIWNFIYYYKDEIYITRLVWWSRIFIYWPFSLQWIIYSVISFFLSLIIYYVLIENINFFSWQWFTLDFLFTNNYLIFSLELILFILIWGFSWYFSSKKYLK